ncbi:MAG TPA: phage portal protein [Bryobacteraceae bacterium]|nr:phage portal protein [Bryobacteraceae bacterium]
MSGNPGKVFVLESSSGAICRVNGYLLSEGMGASSEYFEIAKAANDPKQSQSTGSKRLREKYGITIDGVKCAARPFDFALFAYAVSLNTYHCRCVTQKAKDIAGAPWKITGDGQDAARQEVSSFVDQMFEGLDFSEGAQNVWTDYEALANAYLEVIPDLKGAPAEVSHIVSTEMWIRLDDLGFVQVKNGQFAHFRRYGLDKEAFAELNSKDPLAAGKDVTSVWHFAQYFPWSPYYGIPSIMPAWNRMALAVLETEYNLAFFNNNAIPDYAVILEGSWEDDAEDKIREYFKRHLKGKAHKTMAMRTPDGGKITFEKLTGDNAKEGSFRLLRIDCRDEVLHAHGMPPQKVGIVQPGRLGNGSDEQNQQYKDSIVTPGRKKLLSPINRIIGERFPGTKFRLEFEPYDTDDIAQNAEVDQIYLQTQVLTPGQVQQKRFPDLPFRPGSDQVLPRAGAGVQPSTDELGSLQKRVRRALREAKA